MRPYLAIIKDAFREAFSTWTLWILLILTSLFLLIVLPIGYVETLSTGLAQQDVKNWPALVGRLLRAQQSERLSPARHIVSLFDEDLQDALAELGKQAADSGEPPAEKGDSGEQKGDSEKQKGDSGERKGDLEDSLQTTMRLPRALNEILKKPEFFVAEAWQSKNLRAELVEMINENQGSLTQQEIEHRNRLLLEEAFPDLIRPVPQRSYQMTYLGFNFLNPFTVRKQQFQATVQSILLFFLLFFFGTAGVLIAIMVTAPIIPQTFDPGSLNLLLSKPISRSMMFISQYLGGLSFIAILAAYTFAGLCLVLGTRLGYWNFKLLYYIPSFVFIFAIYYAVSCLISLVWRSTAISIILTMVFWLACAGVGFIKLLCDMPLEGLETKQLVQSEQGMFAIRNQGDVLLWNDRVEDWQPTFVSADGEPSIAIHGPIYDAKRERIVSQHAIVRQGSPIPFSTDQALRFAGPDDGWLRHVGPRLPVGVLDVKAHPHEGFLVFAVSGIYRLKGELPVPASPAEGNAEANTDANSDKTGMRGGLSGVLDMISGGAPPSEEFEQIGPDDGYSLFGPWSAEVNPADGQVAVYSRGVISVFAQDDAGQFKLVKTRELPGEVDQKPVLAFGGDALLLYRPNDGVLVLNRDSLEEESRFSPSGHTAPRSIVFSRSGELAAITMENQKLWLYDRGSNKFFRPRVKSRDVVNSAVFGKDDQLVYSDKWLAVHQVDPSGMQALETYAGETTPFLWFYRYILNPVYTIFPKPGKLNNTVQYLVTGDDTREDYLLSMIRLSSGYQIQDMGEVLAANFPRVYLDPWPPVWNGAIFVVLVLTVGCLYIERQQY